jgi:chromate transporter
MSDERRRSRALREIAGLFLRLGATAFGGPAAHIAMMEAEVVRRRGWLSREAFLDLIAATNLIPGPNSTELAIHIGHRRAGWPGLLVAGSCFILPAALLTSIVAWAYVRFGTLPEMGHVLHGIKPVIIVIVLQALWLLGRTAVKSRALAAVAVVATAVSFAGVNELLVLLLSGLFVAGSRGITRRPGPRPGVSALVPMALAAPAGGAAPAAAVAFGLAPLFLFFLKIGAILFGSGYVLLAFLRADLVQRWHWLSEAQLLDAVTVGQITPGPVFTTATFIGYVLGGARGAAVATIGIFLPAFVLVALSGPLVPRLRRSPAAGAFLDGVNVASLALMTAVTWHLGRAALADPPSVVIAVAAAIALFRFRLDSLWLVIAGAAIGALTGPRG